MHRNKARATAWLLLLAVVLILPACTAPTATEAATTAPVPTATASPTPTPTPSPTPTPEPTASPSPSPTAEPTASSTPVPTWEAGAPGVIGLYELRKSHKLLTEHNTKWVRGTDIGVFFAVATNDASVKHPRHRTTLLNYWNKFPKRDGYKIGYSVQVLMKSGEMHEITIQSALQVPKDPKAYFYKYIEIYLYDDIHLNKGETYATYHLIKKSITPETLMTSIKLTPGVKYREVAGINLTAFVFKGDSDFDPVTGKYIGTVSYTIPVNRTN